MKTFIFVIGTSLLLTGCVSQRHQNEVVLAALKESPTLQAEVLERCKKTPIQRGALADAGLAFLNDPSITDDQAQSIICERLVAGLANGKINQDDMNRVSREEYFTPAMLEVLSTPVSKPKTAVKKSK